MTNVMRIADARHFCGARDKGIIRDVKGILGCQSIEEMHSIFKQRTGDAAREANMIHIENHCHETNSWTVL